MSEKIKVKVVMQTKKENVQGWPHINYSYDKKAKDIMSVLENECDDMEFDLFFYTSVGEAKASYENDKKNYAGILLLEGSNWIDVDLFYIDQIKNGNGMPFVLSDVAYGGSGAILKARGIIEREHLSIPVLSSLNLNDIVEAVSCFRVLQKMKETTILVISDRDHYVEFIEPAKQMWGCNFVTKTSKDIMKYFKAANVKDAEMLAHKWVDEAEKVLEPSFEEIVASAKLYYGLMQMLKDFGANALTVDCLGLFYVGDAPAYPCMTFFEMLRDGQVGVCEADIDATISNLLVMYATNKPGFVSDPVIDTHGNQIIYAHCTYCNTPFGKNDKRKCPYFIRNHAEDRKGVANQVILPTNEDLTTIKISLLDKAASIHSSRSVGNVTEEAGCRTKLSAEVPAENVFKNWHFEKFSWHRITVFGDYRRLFKTLFTIKSLEIIEEDKE
jgi:hypothetical protein